jgi:hypothetical protein
MYVFNPSECAFRYYSLVLGVDFREVIVGGNLMEDFENEYRRELDRLQGRDRVWVLFSFFSNKKGEINEESCMVGYLEVIGRRRDQVRYNGASAYMFDLSASSEIVKEGK